MMSFRFLTKLIEGFRGILLAIDDPNLATTLIFNIKALRMQFAPPPMDLE